MPPLVSVVIPCHSQARFLAAAIESVLAQTHRSHEIVVIDDGSPDEVGDIAARYPVILHRLPKPLGVANARNLGLEKTQGEYVVCLDADDRLLPTALATGVMALSSRPGCALVWGTRRLIDGEGHVLPATPHTSVGTTRYADLLSKNVVGPPAVAMFRRSAVAAVGGFATGFQGAEDYELFLRLAREYAVYAHGQLVAEYRIHDANMSADHTRMLESVLSVLDRQEPVIGRNRELRRALAAGRRSARESYDAERRLNLLSEYTRTRRWGRAVLGSAQLLLRYPRIFLPILLRRSSRALLPRS